MRTWPVHDANARFEDLLDTCLDEGPQMVTNRGKGVAVLVPMQEWRRLQSAAQPTLKQLLLSHEVRTNLISKSGRAQVGEEAAREFPPQV